jgi:hypothetical protein
VLGAQYEKHPLSFIEVLKLQESDDIWRENSGLVTVARILVRGKPLMIEADLPWLYRRSEWMAPFLACLASHGREDCMCWRQFPPETTEKEAFWHYRGLRRQITGMNRSMVFGAPWRREYERALQIWRENNPGMLLPIASRFLPWAVTFLELIRGGASQHQAVLGAKISPDLASLTRKRHRWFDERLTALGIPRSHSNSRGHSRALPSRDRAIKEGRWNEAGT